MALNIHIQGKFNNHTVCSLYRMLVTAPMSWVWWKWEILPWVGIEPTSLAFRANVLPLHHIGSLMSPLYPFTGRRRWSGRHHLEDHDMEVMWSELKHGTKGPSIIGVCYRPPKQGRANVDQFLTKLNDTITDLQNSNQVRQTPSHVGLLPCKLDPTQRGHNGKSTMWHWYVLMSVVHIEIHT